MIRALSRSPIRRKLNHFRAVRENAGFDAPAVLDFLKDLTRQLRGPIVLVWDNLNVHRSKLIRAYVRRLSRLHLEYLPPYAPELNPVEWLNESATCHALANHGKTHLPEWIDLIQPHAQTARASPDQLRGCLHACRLPMRA